MYCICVLCLNCDCYYMSSVMTHVPATIYVPTVPPHSPHARGEGGGGEWERGRGGEGGDRLGWGHIQIRYKAQKNYTKPNQTIQR